MTLSEFINKIGFRVNNEDVNRVNNTISGIKDTATKLLGALGVGLSLTAINGLVEEFTRVNNQIRNSTSALGEQAEIQQQIMKSAEATRTSYEQSAGVISDLVHENAELFGNVEEAVKFNNAATMLFKTAGKTNEEIAGLMEAINKSFAKGKVDSETISQLLERSPEAVALLNKQLGTTTDKLEQLASDGRISLADLKAAFVDNAYAIEAGFANVKYTISDALTVIRSKWGLWLADTNETLGVTDVIGRTMVSAFNKVIGVLNKVRNGIVWLSDKLGGTQKMFKLLAIIAGATFAALNLDRVIKGLSNVAKMVGSVRLKTLALIAIIVLIALIVEDFINFMQGNDSVIGSLLEKAGIDTEKVRQTIIGAWEKIKAFLLAAWDAIKAACSAIWGGLKDFFAKHGDQIKSGFTAVWNAIKAVLIGAWNIIKTVATTIFDGLLSFWSKHGDQVKTGFSNIWAGIQNLLTTVWNLIKTIATALFDGLKAFWDTWGSTIITMFIGIWDTIKAVFSAVFDVLADLFAVFAAVFAGDWEEVWAQVKNLFSDLWNGLVNIVSTALNAIWNVISSMFAVIWEFISGIAASIWEAITTAFTNIWTSVTETVGNIKNSIVDGFTAAIEWIKSLPAQALQWGADIIQGIVDGIMGAIGKVGDAVAGVADKIKSFLGFSEPEDGPLSDFHTYMPDMIDLMAKGIQNGREKVKNALGAIAGDMSITAKANVENGDMPDPDNGKPRPKGSPDMIGRIANEISALKSKVKNALDAVGGDMTVMARANVVSSGTAAAATGSNQVNKSVVQNVEIKNEFKGDAAIQKEAAGAMDKSAKDVTAELARGLAYAK